MQTDWNWGKRRKAVRLARGLILSLSFSAMLVQFYLFCAQPCPEGLAQQTCHHLFFLTLNLALLVFNMYRWFFGLRPVRIGVARSVPRP